MKIENDLKALGWNIEYTMFENKAILRRGHKVFSCEITLNTPNYEIHSERNDPLSKEDLSLIYSFFNIVEKLYFMGKIEPGTKLRIINMKDEEGYDNREGVVTSIDSEGQIHGTWGGLAILPDIDEFCIIL